MRAIYQTEFSARVHSEINDCWFSSILCLSDKWIVVIDRLQLRIKVFNGKYTYISSIETNFMCGGVTATDEEEIAVTNGEEIVFYRINKGKIELLKKNIELPGTGSIGSILKYDGEFFAVIISDLLSESREIQILDSEGRLEKHVTSQIFKTKWKDVRDLEMNKEKKELYLTDITSEKVFCLSYDGKALWEIPIKGGPHGVLLRNDRLLVSVLTHEGPNSVLLASPSGVMCGEVKIEKCELNRPECIALQPETGNLLVSCFRADRIKVFQIQT